MSDNPVSTARDCMICGARLNAQTDECLGECGAQVLVSTKEGFMAGFVEVMAKAEGWRPVDIPILSAAVVIWYHTCMFWGGALKVNNGNLEFHEVHYLFEGPPYRVGQAIFYLGLIVSVVGLAAFAISLSDQRQGVV